MAWWMSEPRVSRHGIFRSPAATTTRHVGCLTQCTRARRIRQAAVILGRCFLTESKPVRNFVSGEGEIHERIDYDSSQLQRTGRGKIRPGFIRSYLQISALGAAGRAGLTPLPTASVRGWSRSVRLKLTRYVYSHSSPHLVGIPVPGRRPCWHLSSPRSAPGQGAPFPPPPLANIIKGVLVDPRPCRHLTVLGIPARGSRADQLVLGKEPHNYVLGFSCHSYWNALLENTGPKSLASCMESLDRLFVVPYPSFHSITLYNPPHQPPPVLSTSHSNRTATRSNEAPRPPQEHRFYDVRVQEESNQPS